MTLRRNDNRGRGRGPRRTEGAPAHPAAMALAAAAMLVAGPVVAENASNPLAAVNNTDLRAQTFDLGDADRTDYFIDGAVMARPDLKLKYELHYNQTDVTGTDEENFEKANLKAIYFATQGQLNDSWGYRTAVGLEWIVDLGDVDKGIGTESDQLAPAGRCRFRASRQRHDLDPADPALRILQRPDRCQPDRLAPDRLAALCRKLVGEGRPQGPLRLEQ